MVGTVAARGGEGTSRDRRWQHWARDEFDCVFVFGEFDDLMFLEFVWFKPLHFYLFSKNFPVILSFFKHFFKL